MESSETVGQLSRKLEGLARAQRGMAAPPRASPAAARRGVRAVRLRRSSRPRRGASRRLRWRPRRSSPRRSSWPSSPRSPRAVSVLGCAGRRPESGRGEARPGSCRRGRTNGASDETGLRLGGTDRRSPLLVGRGDPARAGGGLFPRLFDPAGLAEAAGPDGDRPRGRRGPAGGLRTEGGAPLSGHGERARRLGHRDPLRHLLRRLPAVGVAEPGRGVRADGPGHRRGRAPVDPARFGVHRPPRPRRRLLDAGAALDGPGQPDRAVRLPAAAERRPRLGGLPEALAGARRAEPALHDPLPVGLGHDVPHARQAAGRQRDLPGVPDPRLRVPRPGGPVRRARHGGRGREAGRGSRRSPA